MKKNTTWIFLFFSLFTFSLLYSEKIMDHFIGTSSAPNHGIEKLLVSIFFLLLAIFFKLKD
jgi:hypothetical protein